MFYLQRVKEALGNIRTTEIAQFDKALIEAFDLLQMVQWHFDYAR